MVSCECNPAVIYSTNGYAIISEKTKSCGCLKNEITIDRNISNSTHNLSKHKLCHVHKAMIRRCENMKDKHYEAYGGRGITVCDEWHDLNIFFNWAIDNGYKEGLSIDRINNDLGYNPNNCEWIPMSDNVAKRNKEYAIRKMADKNKV